MDIILSQRENFSNMMLNLLLINPNIEIEINNLIKELNNLENTASALFGGRSWINNLLNYGIEYNDFNDGVKFNLDILSNEEQSSIIPGNFDIFCVTNFIKYDKVYSIINSKISNIYNNFVEAFEKSNSDYKVNYDIIAETNLKRGERTIGKNATSWIFYIKKKHNLKIKEDEKDELMPRNDEQKMLFYFEYDRNNDVDTDNFKFLLQEDKINLNPLGLFILSNFLIKPRSEKKFVDVNRSELFNTYLMEPLIRFTYNILELDEPSINTNEEWNLLIQKTMILIFWEIFQKIFKDEEEVRSYIFDRCMKNYGATFTDEGIEYNFNDYMKQLNDFLLDSPAGGNNQFNNLLSIRQLLQYIITVIFYNLPNYQTITGSGGDTIRKYISNVITLTEDIDTKLYYTKFGDTREKLIFILLILCDYLLEYQYYRFQRELIINFGGEIFKMNINTLNQERIARTRALYDFVVPLLSVDVKLSYTIERNTGETLRSNIILSPLDIAFKKASESFITNAKENDINTISHNLDLSLYKLDENEEQKLFSLMPIPTINDVHNDIYNNVNNPKRRAERIEVNKHIKDDLRLEAMDDLQNKFINSSDEEREIINQELLNKRLEIEQVSELNNDIQINILAFFNYFINNVFNIKDDELKILIKTKNNKRQEIFLEQIISSIPDEYRILSYNQIRLTWYYFKAFISRVNIKRRSNAPYSQKRYNSIANKIFDKISITEEEFNDENGIEPMDIDEDFIPMIGGVNKTRKKRKIKTKKNSTRKNN